MIEKSVVGYEPRQKGFHFCVFGIANSCTNSRTKWLGNILIIGHFEPKANIRSI